MVAYLIKVQKYWQQATTNISSCHKWSVEACQIIVAYKNKRWHGSLSSFRRRLMVLNVCLSAWFSVHPSVRLCQYSIVIFQLFFCIRVHHVFLSFIPSFLFVFCFTYKKHDHNKKWSDRKKIRLIKSQKRRKFVFKFKHSTWHAKNVGM